MHITVIGYGEVGRILAEDLRAQGLPVTAYDVKLRGEAGEPMREHALRHGVALGTSHAHAVQGAELVVSAVTAEITSAAPRTASACVAASSTPCAAACSRRALPASPCCLQSCACTAWPAARRSSARMRPTSP